VILMGLAGVLMFFFSRQLISLFTPDQEVIALGSIGIKIMALSEPFFALSIVITGILRGAGDSKWPFYITAIGMWGVRLIAVYALCYPLGLGIYGAWIAMVLDLAVRGLLSLWRLRSKVWLDAW
jgi:Na+-driven multidrug efflux pump